MFKKIIAFSAIVAVVICSVGLTSFAEYISTESSVLGDVDGDGKLTTTDFLRIKKHFLGDVLLEGDEFLRADVNNDGAVGSSDYLYLRNVLINISENNVIVSGANDKNNADEPNAPTVNETPVKKTITLYVPDDNYEGFKLYRAYFDGSAKGIVAALSNMGALPEGVEVNSFEIDGNTAKIDLSEEFGVALNDSRTFESIFLGSLANTIIDYYGVEYLTFTVEGEVFETGLNVYDFPIEFIEKIKVYVPNEEYDGLVSYDTYFNGTVEDIVSMLIKSGALPKGVEVNSFEIDGNTAKIDLSKEFGVALNEARTFESIFLGSLANTIIDYYGVEYLAFTVEGEVFETGLNVYDFPIEFIEKIKVYVPNEEYDGLVSYDTYFNGTVEGIVSMLINSGVLPEGVEVNSFEIDGNTAKIDLSEEFGVALNEARTFESIFLGSLANTIIDYYDVEYLTFTVEGEVFETGLNVYDSPVEFFPMS